MNKEKKQKCDTTQKEKSIWKELRKDGITNEDELNVAINKMSFINISCFVSKVI